MFQTISNYSTKVNRRLAAFALGALAIVVLSGSVSATGQCRTVKGRIFEEKITEDCQSPLDDPLCIASKYKGGLKGTGKITVNEFLFPGTLDGTNVSLFASDSVVDARVGNRAGKLIIKHAGAFQLAGGNELVDLQTIVGGEGDFYGASGFMQVIGDFSLVENRGESQYVGEICLP